LYQSGRLRQANAGRYLVARKQMSGTGESTDRIV